MTSALDFLHSVSQHDYSHTTDIKLKSSLVPLVSSDKTSAEMLKFPCDKSVDMGR